MSTQDDQGTVSVYRVESKDGAGMYHWHNVINPMQECAGAHPLPERDTVLVRAAEKAGLGSQSYNWTEYRYGFADLTQFQRWLYDRRWAVWCRRHGGVLAEYRVPAADVIVGSTQALYLPDFAELTHRHDILEVWDAVAA